MPKNFHIKISFLVKTFFALALMTQIASVAAAEIGEHMKAGQQLFQTKMYKAAITEFEQATQEQPNDPTAHYYLAVSHVHAGNVSKAFPHFQQAIGLSPETSQIHQMATAALNAYQNTQAATDPPVASSNGGPLLPSRSFNGGASAELDRSAAGGGYSSTANQSTYSPNRNYPSSSYSSSSYSQGSQLQPGLYSQNYNHIPGYQTSWGANRSTGTLWGTATGNRRHGFTVPYYGGQQTQGTPSLAISNSIAPSFTPITKDMSAADQALSMIKRQSDRQVQLAATGAHMEYYDANTRSQINQINQNTNDQINKLLTPTWHYGRRGGGYYSSASQAQIDAINSQARFRITNLQRDTDRAEGARQVQQATTESASNLSDQIRNQKLTGSGVLLRAEGTNLNVRNYETFHSDQDDRDAILPMVAHPLTLKEAEKSLPVLPLTVPTKHYSIDQ